MERMPHAAPVNVEIQTMAVIDELGVPTVDVETVFPALEAAHYAASVLLQMLIDRRGAGPWIDEMHQNMRNGLDKGPPPEGWPGSLELWQEAQHSALRAIFDHQHMVGSIKPKN